MSLHTLSYIGSNIWSFWCILQWSGMTLFYTHWPCTYLLWSSVQELFPRGMITRHWIRNLKKPMLSSHNLWSKKMIVLAFSELPYWIRMELHLIGCDEILESIGWYSYFLDEWKIHWTWRRIKCWAVDETTVWQSRRLCSRRQWWWAVCVTAFSSFLATSRQVGVFSG